MAWWLLLAVLLECTQGTLSSKCQPNAFINKLDLLLPLSNSLVHNPYYTKLSAEVSGDLAVFRSIQDEFHLCAHVTTNNENGIVEVFHECGRSVFGQGAVPAVEGDNMLTVSLFHNSTQLCEVSVTVRCCINQDTIAAMEKARKEAVMADFLLIGRQLTEQVAQLGVLPDASRTPAARLASALREQHSMNVLVGIKSSALNLVKRNSIRATWLRDIEQENSAFLGAAFHPFFLIGPPSSGSHNASIEEILEVEYAFYQDTLRPELGPVHGVPVTDSYWTLGEKVLSFAKWGLGQIPEGTMGYVVICDDDVFVDTWQLQRHLAGLSESQTSTYYAGEVLEVRMHDTYKPIRDPQHRNYLPVESYPLPTLPPFALGNFYILGGRLWEYIGRNADMLRPTGTLEDLSVGVWMLGLQVFPTHLSGVCDITRCLYDASLFTEDSADVADTAPAPRLLAVADLQRRADFDLLHRMTSYRLQHGMGNSQAALNLTKSTVAYISALHSQPTAPAPVTSETAASTEGGDVAETTTPQSEEQTNIVSPTSDVLTTSACSIRVILGRQAIYALDVVAQLVRTALPDCHIEQWYSVAIASLQHGEFEVTPLSAAPRLLREDQTRHGSLELQGARVLLVLSVLDCVVLNRTAVDPLLQLRWAASSDSLLRAASAAVRTSTVAAATVLISGEPVDLSKLPVDALDLLLTTTRDEALAPPDLPVLYLPVLATAFYEMSRSEMKYSPLELLRASSDRDGTAMDVERPLRSGVAYLYHRCDRPAREAFFSLLQSHLPAGALEPLGRCFGVQGEGNGSKEPSTSRSHGARQALNSRFSDGYIGEAVALYKSFRFVLAFENIRIDGYVTEKLLTAYLGGAVPVYLGAPDVTSFFNPASMINCADFADLAACADRVAEVYADEAEYARMRAQVPVIDEVAWSRMFSLEEKAATSAAGREAVLLLKSSLLKLVT